MARAADGGMRDAQSIFDQIIAFCGGTGEGEMIREQDVIDVGLGRTMAEMSSIIVPDAEVQSYVDAMIDVVGGPSVTAEVVDELPGDLGGRYSAAERLIQIDRPATVWIIAHEVAHTVSTGHDEEFQETLVQLGRFFERSTG